MKPMLVHFQHEIWAAIPGDHEGKWRKVDTMKSEHRGIEEFRNLYRGQSLPIEGAAVLIISRSQPITTEKTA